MPSDGDRFAGLRDDVDVGAEQVFEDGLGAQDIEREHARVGQQRDMPHLGRGDRLANLRVALGEVIDEPGHHLHHVVLLPRR